MDLGKGSFKSYLFTLRRSTYLGGVQNRGGAQNRGGPCQFGLAQLGLAQLGLAQSNRKMREVQLAAGGRQVAPTFPLIGAHSNLVGVGWGGVGQRNLSASGIWGGVLPISPIGLFRPLPYAAPPEKGHRIKQDRTITFETGKRTVKKQTPNRKPPQKNRP